MERKSSRDELSTIDRAEKEKQIRKIFHEQYLRKLEAVENLKNTIFEFRFNNSFAAPETTTNLKELLAQLKQAEEEARQFRNSVYNKFDSSLDLENVNVVFPKFSDNPTGTTSPRQTIETMSAPRSRSGSRTRTSSNASTTSVPIFASTSKSPNNEDDNYDPTQSLTSNNEDNKAMQKWSSTLNVVQSGLQWKRFWQQKKQVTEAENILHHSNSAKLTKEQIIKLRATLYTLREKKNITKSDLKLKSDLEAKLKTLEEKYKQEIDTERAQNSTPSVEENN